MERTDGVCMARWSAIVCEWLWRGFSNHGQKSGKHVCENRLSSKNGHKKNTPPKTTEFYHILPYFTQFYHFLYFAALWSPRDHVVASPTRA